MALDLILIQLINFLPFQRLTTVSQQSLEHKNNKNREPSVVIKEKEMKRNTTGKLKMKSN